MLTDEYLNEVRFQCCLLRMKTISEKYKGETFFSTVYVVLNSLF